MKTKIFLPLVAITLIYTLSSISGCSENDQNPAENYFLKATINSDINFESNGLMATATSLQNIGENILGINGMTENNGNIQIQIDLTDYNGVGTYNEQQITFIYSIEDNQNNVFYTTIVNGNGVLQITEEDNNHIKGNFNFQATLTAGNPSFFNLGETITVNNGTFNVKKIN